MLTREEYEKTYVRMMDSLRSDNYKGRRNCDGVECSKSKCPLNLTCNSGGSTVFKAAEYIEVVEKWGKEHPIATRADKFKEVFGVEPRHYIDDNYICPRKVGLDICHDLYESCSKCVKDFWESEYVDPKGE